MYKKFIEPVWFWIKKIWRKVTDFISKKFD